MPNEQPSEFVLDVVDWQGRRVHMTARTFSSHELRHPEIREYLEEAKQTIADPDIVLEDNDSGVLLYRYGLGRQQYDKTYLVVIVHYSGHIGIVATYFFTRRLADLPIRESRFVHIGGQRIRLSRG